MVVVKESGDAVLFSPDRGLSVEESCVTVSTLEPIHTAPLPPIRVFFLEKKVEFLPLSPYRLAVKCSEGRVQRLEHLSLFGNVVGQGPEFLGSPLFGF